MLCSWIAGMYQTTLFHIPEGCNLTIHKSKNVISHKGSKFYISKQEQPFMKKKGPPDSFKV